MKMIEDIQIVPNGLEHSNFGYPVFIKEISFAWSFLVEYKVT